MQKLKLGIIGMSEGNGHPYSWSAICNGFDPNFMKDCPFPVIPEYLGEQKWPDAQLDGVEVTHVWTQDKELSKGIASSSLIPNITDKMTDMIGQVDAVLLARDDAEKHTEMALPFIKEGVPIFIDKPFALSTSEANQMLMEQDYEGQVFSCSSLRYARELYLSDEQKEEIGTVRFIEAQIPKSWEKYAVHLIEPIVAGNPQRGMLKNVKTNRNEGIVRAEISWQNLHAFVTTYGDYPCPLQITYFGESKMITKSLTDTFNAFKISIEVFITHIGKDNLPIARKETEEIIGIIEKGIKCVES